MNSAAAVGLWPWLLQRVSGAALLALLGIHMFVTHFADPPPLTFDKVADRFRFSPNYWPWFDSLFLLIAIFHALNGVRTILYDFRPGPRARFAITLSLWIIGLAAAAAGHYILFPYARAGR